MVGWSSGLPIDFHLVSERKLVLAPVDHKQVAFPLLNDRDMYLRCIALVYGRDCGNRPDLPSLFAEACGFNVAFILAVMAFHSPETAFVSGMTFFPQLPHGLWSVDVEDWSFCCVFC